MPCSSLSVCLCGHSRASSEQRLQILQWSKGHDLFSDLCFHPIIYNIPMTAQVNWAYVHTVSSGILPSELIQVGLAHWHRNHDPATSRAHILYLQRRSWLTQDICFSAEWGRDSGGSSCREIFCRLSKKQFSPFSCSHRLMGFVYERKATRCQL